MQTPVDDLWTYVKRQRWLSARELFNRVSLAAACGDEFDLDYRSRLLIRDSLDALARYFGRAYVKSRVARMPTASALAATWESKFDGETGFPSLKHRLMEPITHDDVLRYLRDLGGEVREPTQATIGGSIALIMRDLIVRATEDIDVVNDIPHSIRELHGALQRMQERHDLMLGHFASHYLPAGWEHRTTSLGIFGQLNVRLIDAVDVLIDKLFSLRARDFVDIRAAWNLIDIEDFRRRLARDTAGLRSKDYLAQASKRNWYVLTGEEDLPPLVADQS